MHELDLPRKYRTIYICGGFGVSGNRHQSMEALRRMYEHLEPGGMLILDHEVPYNDADNWLNWTRERRREFPLGGPSRETVEPVPMAPSTSSEDGLSMSTRWPSR